MFTGLTEEILKKDLKKEDRGETVPNRCYLCKRFEGCKSVAIVEGDEPNFCFSKLELHDISVKLREHVLYYKLCFECYMLLKHVNQISERGKDQNNEITEDLDRFRHYQ